MATHLISLNEAADAQGETSVLRFGHSSPLVIANSLIAKLFEEVNEGVRALPRGGAEIGGLLVGPKGHEGGILADEIFPIPIEYRFGPSFRLSSPDLTKIEEAIASLHQDLTKTVVGFYRSKTRGGAEFRDSDQEILLAVELAHAAFGTDFRYFAVLSPPARGEMSVGLSRREGNDWSEFRPYTFHLDPLSATSDLPEEEPLPIEMQDPSHSEPAESNGNVQRIVVDEPADLNNNGHQAAAPETAETVSHEEKTESEAVKPEAVAVQPEAEGLNGNGHQPAAPEAAALANQEDHAVKPEVEEAKPEAEAAKPEVEAVKPEGKALNGNGHKPKTSRAKSTQAKTASSDEAATPKTPRPRTKKTATATTSAATAATATTNGTNGTKTKSRSAAKAEGTTRTAHAGEARSKSHTTAAPAFTLETKSPRNQALQQTAQHLVSLGKALTAKIAGFKSGMNRQHIWWAAAVLAVAAAIMGGYLYTTHRVQPAPQPKPAAIVAPVVKQTLALSAERHGSDLVLSWNRELPSVTRASYGMLIIKGNNGRKDIALTPEQLRAGSITYTPTSDQVEVELSVVAGEQVTKDSVIVLLPRKGNAIVTTAQATGDPAGSPSSPTSLLEREKLKESTGPELASSPPLKPFAPPATTTGAETAGPTRFDEPPPSLSMTKGPNGGVLLPGPQLPQAPATTTEVASIGNRPENSSASPVIVPAVAIQQVMPHLRTAVTMARTIEVKVSIDANGKVVKADAAPQSGLDIQVVAAAIEAARQWKFRPATVNNRPVSSEISVKFNFAPSK